MDTDTVAAAMRSPMGASAGLLLAAGRGRVVLVASVPLVVEYEAVCSRLEHRVAAGLSEVEVRVFLDSVAALMEPAQCWFLWRPQLHDAGDELVLEAAVNGGAEAIVTFNRRDFVPAADRFGVRVLLPREALAICR
jgi:predicted nucleic acid-binding protein